MGKTGYAIGNVANRCAMVSAGGEARKAVWRCRPAIHWLSGECRGRRGQVLSYRKGNGQGKQNQAREGLRKG
jgi:hypothetical protein